MINFQRRPESVYLIIIFLFLLAGCGSNFSGHWSDLVPDSVPFLIVPEEGSDVESVLTAEYIPQFDDLTPSAVQLVSNLVEENAEETILEAILLYPDTSNEWQPIWITSPQGDLFSRLISRYQRQYDQNRYHYIGHTIEKLIVSDREIFALELGEYLIFSESSLGIEAIIRTAAGQEPPVSFEQDHTAPGRFIMNTPSVDNWVQQVAQVSYRPHLIDIFTGASPVSFSFESPADEEEPVWNWQLSGTMDLETDPGFLIRALSSPSGEFTLDQYISVNTSGFTIMRAEPRMVPIEGLEANNETDQYIRENPEIWRQIASQLESELAFATFAESGAASSSEYMYYRKTSGNTDIRNALNDLQREGLAVRDGNTYQVNSRWLAILFGSEMNPMSDFYVTLYRDVAALSQRKGLSQSLIQDAERRRVVYYDDDYIEIRESLQESLSFIVYLDTPQFIRYIQPWLNPQNYLSTLLSGFDQLVLTGEREGNADRVGLKITSYEREDADQPYRENWIFPLGGAEITGTPVLANITAGERDEVVFSTVNGQVIALAADGTSVLEVSTGGQTPVGPPVVYDWYGNNQNVIMQAAGNRIYAWNTNGNLLPNFPISMSETITTPLTIMDVTRNGVAEIVVGTSDRRMHILNARGEPLQGWPQSTNTVVTGKPLITELEGERSVFVFAENALHAWNINSSRRDGFPVFLPTQMAGNPARYNRHILGSGLDGNLYSIGLQPFFSDSLASDHAADSLYVRSISITNSSLNSTPSVHNILLRDEEEGFIREDLILVQSGNGSLFLYNNEGLLRFTKSMGQPGSSTTPPAILDLDGNSRQDLVAVADFGRMYAWDILSGERLYDLPTTGMRYILIDDITGSGQNELLAQTREGLRSWTIIQPRREGAELNSIDDVTDNDN